MLVFINAAWAKSNWTKLPREYNTLRAEFGPPTLDYRMHRGQTNYHLLPRVYNTLHVEFGPPTLDYIMHRGPSLSELIVILTEGIQHFACRVWATDHRLHNAPRAQSGRTHCHPYRGNTTLCMSSFGPSTLDYVTHCGLRLGGRRSNLGLVMVRSMPQHVEM